MKMHKLINRHTLLSALLCASVAHTPTATAAPGALSDTPLFLLNSAKPNIFFVVDDSGSMNLELSTNSSEAQNLYGYVFNLNSSSPGNRFYFYVYDHAMSYNIAPGGVDSLSSGAQDNSDARVVPHPGLIEQLNDPTVIVSGGNLDKAWKARSPAYNKLFYNPDVDYEPWPGFPDATPNNIPQLPGASVGITSLINYRQLRGYVPGIGVRTMENFYPAQYYHWNDEDDDGIIDDDEGVLVYISPGGNDNNTINGDPLARPAASVKCAEGVQPTTSNRCTKRAYADEIQNFANWFTYYRKRLYTAKAAVTLTIDNTFAEKTRMGVASINNQSNAERLIEDMDTGTNKTDLLSLITSPNLDATGSTPLKSALRRAGQYFSCSNSNSFFGGDFTCPIQGMGSANSITANPADGVAGECQQNFTILLTDGEYTNESVSVGSGDNDADTANAFDGAPYADGVNGTLADIAMHYYKNDLSGNLPNKIPAICGLDENQGQHMVSYTVTFGIEGNLTWSDMPNRPIATTACGTPETATAPGWPTGSFDNEDKIDDVLHAAYNGRGKYLSASSPDELISGLENSLLDIASRKGAAAAVGFNSTSNTENTQVYISLFYSGNWNGELSAYGLNPNGSVNFDTPNWAAHELLDYNLDASNGLTDAQVVGDGRAIVTHNRSSDTTYKFGRPFRWTHLTNAQQEDLLTDNTGVVTADTAHAQNRLNFVRGDHSCSAGYSTTDPTALSCSTEKEFRLRRDAAGKPTRMGDMVNSAPIHVEKPVGKYPIVSPFPSATDTTYDDYKDGSATNAAFSSGKTADNRTPIVYIGANDGMLHAFNANTGEEVFAYIPDAVFAAGTTGAGLHKLTEANSHKSYVDLTPSIADAFTKTPADATAKWRTVLVGALRSGGKGIFALDVTDPDAIIAATPANRETEAAKKVMWEFTNDPATGDADLGFTYSEPVIVPLRVDSSNIEWFTVFGNGYNSDSGKAALFLLKLSGPTGAGGKWVLNTDYFKIDTGIGSIASKNGLSTPSVIDTDGDGIFDRAYAGDVLGNMWAFTLTGNNPGSNWKSAYLQGSTPKPLFTATKTAGELQPITSRPLIIRNTQITTDSGNQPNTLVLFGTGQYIADGDQSSTADQSFYAIWDHGQDELLRSNLQEKEFLSISDADLRAINPTPAVDYTAATPDHGWFIDLPEDGERVTNRPILLGSTVFFTTITPNSAPCSAGGTSWLMALNPFTGNSPGIPTFDIDGDGRVSEDEIPSDILSGGSMPSGMKSDAMTPNYSYLIGANQDGADNTPPCESGSHVQGIGMTTGGDANTPNLCAEGGSGKAGRYSWRQLSFD